MVALVAMATPAIADEANADEAEARFRRGAALFRAGRYDEASFGTVFDPPTPEETVDQRGYVEGRWERNLGETRLLLRLAADHADYRLAGVFRPYATGRTKIVVGRAYRAPSSYEQYYSDGGIAQSAAAPLDPETIDTVDLEHTQELSPRAFVSLSLFGSRVRRLIRLVTDDTSGLLVYRNDDDTLLTGGGELEARLAWESGAWVMGAVSVAGISGGDATARTNSLPLMAVTKALVPLGKTASLAVELVYNAPRRQHDGAHTDHVLLGTIAGSGGLPVAGLRWQLTVSNLFDWRYHVPVGDEFRQLAIEQDGRRFVASLVYVQGAPP